MKDIIAVTGATGRLGGATLQHLLNEGVSGADLVVCARDPESINQDSVRGAEVRRADYNDVASLRQAFAGVGTLFFVSSPEAADGSLRVLQHVQVVKAAADAGVERIVYTGLAFAERSKLPIAQHHLATEYAIRSSGIPHTFLRNAFYTEVFVNSELKEAVDAGAIVSNTGEATINSVAREDLARAAARVLTQTGHEFKSYNLVAPRPWTYDELADALSDISSRAVVHRSVSHEAMVGHLVSNGVSPHEAHFRAFLHGTMAEGEGAHRSGDLEHLIGDVVHLKESARRALAS